MKLLLDIDVILDVILAREPWLADSARLLSATERGRASGCVADHTITTVHYVTSANRGTDAATRAVTDLLGFLDVIPVAREDFQRALALDLPDFEDAVQVAAGLKAGVDLIVTRDEGDFEGSGLDALPPGAVLAMM